MSEEKYIRVGVTYYKIVDRPLLSGDTIETLKPWNYDTLRQDHSKDFVTTIPKYDGFCMIPSHLDHQPTVGKFLNKYEPIPHQPQAGDCPTILSFLNHIFGDQIEMGLDYLQLLYMKPLQRLPILLLVSRERNTGKTTFLNFLKSIFAGNMTFNTNEDFHSQFNSDWAGKLIVAVDEVLLNRKEDSERIKNLSTAKSYKAEAKGKDRNEIEFFAKFVLCSNNEVNPVIIEEGETRYWVIKIPPLTRDDNHIVDSMKKEIPHFLQLLINRQLSTRQEGRMWFRPSLLATPALRKIIAYNRGKLENEMLTIIDEINHLQQLNRFTFCVADLAVMLEMRGGKAEHSHIRRILQENWQLIPARPARYTTYRFQSDGMIREYEGVGRVYTISRERIDEMLLLCYE